MKDRRVAYVRGVLAELVESLDATVRLERWDGDEAIPSALRASADLLAERLGKANRLAADRFVGSPIAVRAISELGTAINRLDQAFVAYRSSVDRAEGAVALDAEIARVRSEVNLDQGA